MTKSKVNKKTKTASKQHGKHPASAVDGKGLVVQVRIGYDDKKPLIITMWE